MPDKDAWNQFSCLSVSAIENSECIALRQQGLRREHVHGDQLAAFACIYEFKKKSNVTLA